MKKRNVFQNFVSGLAGLLFLVLSASAWGLDLEKASTGLPQVAQAIGKDSFVPVKAKRLKDAQVLWVNFELLHEMGIDVPTEGLTPEFAEKILESFAYLIPRATDRPEEYLDQTKTFYADRYGGLGMGNALGSGRAAGAGLFQIKGIGQTPLVGEILPEEKKPIFKGAKSLAEIFQRIWDRFVLDNHNHGGVTLREAMAEAAWGEILHKELPYGANRVAFIIGTRQAIGIAKHPRAIMVRENSIRPAHYVINDNVSTNEAEKEVKRVEKLIQPFASLSLVEQNKNASLAERVGRVVGAIYERVARQFGSEYALSIYHGSSSPSNVEVTGRAIDHGPLTALDGFTKAQNVNLYPNGDPQAFLEEVLNDFLNEFKRTLPENIHDHLPSQKKLERIAIAAYYDQFRKDLLWRLGFPRDLADALSLKKEGKDLADLLLDLAEKGNNKVISTKKRVPVHTGLYDMNKVMIILSSKAPDEEKLLRLSKEVPQPGSSKALLKKYNIAIEALDRQLKREGASLENLLVYLDLASKQRNITFYQLMRGEKMYVRQFFHVVLWTLSRFSSAISSYVDGMLAKYGRAPTVYDPRDLVLEEIKDRKTGASLRRIYDSRTGAYKTQIVSYNVNNKVQFFKSELPWARLKEGVELQIKQDRVAVSDIIEKGDKVVINLQESNLDLNRFKKVMFLRTSPEKSCKAVFTGPVRPSAFQF